MRWLQSTTRVKPFICTMPMRLDEGWNQIQFNLSDFTRRAYGERPEPWTLLDCAGLHRCHTDAAHLMTAAGLLLASGTLAGFVRHSSAAAFSAVALGCSKLHCPGLL